MKRKLLSILLTLCLAFSLLPTAALAVEGEDAKTGNLTFTTANQTISGFTYTSGTMTINAENVTVENVTFGDGAILTVNTSGKFTLKNCTFNGKSFVRTPVTLNVGSAEVTSNTFNGTQKNGTPSYYNAIEFAVSSGNKLAEAILSNNTFEAPIQNNYFSTYYYADQAVITAENNVIKIANRESNAIRISNVTNSNVTFKLNNNSYEFSDASGSSEYEGFILLQDFSKSDAVQDFSKVTIEINGLTAPADATRLFYVYDDQEGIIAKNQPIVKGDSSIEKFFVAKVDKTYYKTLAAAVAAAQDGATITLLKDTTESNIVLKKNGTLDLGGHTLDAGATNRYGLRAASGVDVTIQNGTVKNAFSALSIWGSNDSSKPTKVTVAQDVTFTDSGYGIILAGYSTANDFKGKIGYAVLNFNGTITTGDNQCPIFVMGNLGDNAESATAIGENGNQINIGATARITSKEEGIVLNGMAKLSVVDGATITGADAITMKRGYLNITGGTFTGTGAKKVPTDAEHSGAEQSGSAITVSSTYNYSGLIDVKISGGTFKSTNSYGFYAGQSVENGTAIAFTNTTFAISGGNFSGGEAAVYFATGKHITGGYFTSDPSAYVADGYISVTSDVSGYSYKVVEKTNTGSVEVKPAVAEPEVKVSGNIAENDKTAVENAAKTVSAPTLGAAAADEAQKIDETKANDLIKAATNLGDGEKKLYVQSALKVEPTAYDKESKTLTLEITPQYRIVASTADKADNIELSGNSKNAQVVQDYQKLTITAPTVVTMELPTGFAADGDKLSIKHTKDNGTVEYYTGKVTADGGKLYLTFTTKGFSPFTISAPAASIGETMYPTLAEAIAKAANGNAVKLEKNCEESVTVSGKSLTIDKNNYVYDFTNVTVDSNSTKTENGDTLTITYTAPSSSSSGSSGSYDPTYSVSTPSKTENGTVTVSPKSASKGDTVTVTVKPDSGYVLETLTVTDSKGNELKLTDKGDGKYTFTMPSGKVEVKATFMEDNSMLNFFYDVPNNAYFYEAVKWAVKNGITDGVGDNLFAPEQPCTRAQIVTFLWRAAGSPEPKGAASGMTDVVSGSYYEKAVAWAIENGITTGTTTSTFSPDATCTRAQAVTFLARALNAKAASAAEFSDVPTGSYFADAVAWAAANGVTEGIGGGLFGSDNDCTRGQIVTFLYRAYNK